MTKYGCPYCNFEARTKDEVKAHITCEDDADHRDRNGFEGTSSIEILGDGEEEFDTEDGHNGNVTTEGIDDVLENELGRFNGESSANDDSDSTNDDRDDLWRSVGDRDEGMSVPRDELLRIEAELWAFEHADEVNVEAALEMLDTRLGELAKS